jgi:hypothetical protein
LYKNLAHRNQWTIGMLSVVKSPPNGWKTRDPHRPYLGQNREYGRMRTRKDERKKESPPTVGKPETPTNPILVSIESLVECVPVRTREKKTEHDEERDWVIHST